MPAAAAYHIDFSGDGDKLVEEDERIPGSCMLGLRLAARNIFHCSLQSLRTVLPPECERIWSIDTVMAYLACQKRTEMQLSNSTAVLQVVTVDEFQSVASQSKVFQRPYKGLPDEMMQNLGLWMIQGLPLLFRLFLASCCV